MLTLTPVPLRSAATEDGPSPQGEGEPCHPLGNARRWEGPRVAVPVIRDGNMPSLPRGAVEVSSLSWGEGQGEGDPLPRLHSDGEGPVADRHVRWLRREDLI